MFFFSIDDFDYFPFPRSNVLIECILCQLHNPLPPYHFSHAYKKTLMATKTTKKTRVRAIGFGLLNFVSIEYKIIFVTKENDKEFSENGCKYEFPFGVEHTKITTKICLIYQIYHR